LGEKRKEGRVKNGRGGKEMEKASTGEEEANGLKLTPVFASPIRAKGRNTTKGGGVSVRKRKGKVGQR